MVGMYRISDASFHWRGHHERIPVGITPLAWVATVSQWVESCLADLAARSSIPAGGVIFGSVTRRLSLPLLIALI